MRFFDRTEEIASLRKIREMAQDNAQFDNHYYVLR